MKLFNQEEYLFLAKLAQQSERYKDMIEFVQEFDETELTKEERNTLANAYNNVIGVKRAELRVLAEIEDREQNKQAGSQIMTYIGNYQNKILNELKDKCQEILILVRDKLYPNAQQIETKVFYLKLIGDYNRYLAEFKQENDLFNAIEQANEAYMYQQQVIREAVQLAQTKLSPTLPLYLKVMLNTAVFMADILENLSKARELCKDSFEKGLLFLEQVKEENLKEFQALGLRFRLRIDYIILIMNKFSREEFLFLARIAQQTERFNDMIEFIKHFLDQELNKEERSILSAAYKNVVGNKRAELRVLTAIEQKESRKQTDQYTLNYIRNYKHKIEGELKNSCAEILNLIDSTLYPNAKQVDSKVFYLKMKGDYNRYLAEFLLDNEYHAAVEQATQAYKEADVLAKANLSTTSPIRLGLHLNQSVFYYEILQNATEAIRIANEAFEQAIAQVDTVNEENYKDCTLIMQLLRDNLTLWNNPEEENNDDQ